MSAKGDCARIIFYLNLRYGLDISKVGSVEMFKEWNEIDPVDPYEVRHNNVVYKYQKNRNPFIDYPELVDYIYGDKTTTAWEAVEKQSQVITFAELANKTFGDAAFNLSATSTSNLEVSFELVSGPATLVGKRLSLTGAGEVVIKASQLGNDEYLAATDVTRTFTVNKKSQTINFAELFAKNFGDADFDLSATSSSNLAVSFELISGPATLSGKTLSITGAGEVVIKASQAGNENILAAEQTRILMVLKANQVITFDPIDDYVIDAGSINLVASSSSLLEVEFEIVEGAGEIAANVFTPTTSGQFTIRAYQNGNDNYKAAESVQTFNVNQVTGIDDVFVEEIQMYPNPATDFVVVEFPDAELKQIKLLNIKGQLIKTTQAHQNLRLNVRDLKVGMYFISIQKGESIVTKRFVKTNN